jgi:hypothetical protein
VCLVVALTLLRQQELQRQMQMQGNTAKPAIDGDDDDPLSQLQSLAGDGADDVEMADNFGDEGVNPPDAPSVLGRESVPNGMTPSTPIAAPPAQQQQPQQQYPPPAPPPPQQQPQVTPIQQATPTPQPQPSGAYAPPAPSAATTAKPADNSQYKSVAGVTAGGYTEVPPATATATPLSAALPVAPGATATPAPTGPGHETTLASVQAQVDG